jgi:ABC-type amino acid transport substrate-binding protein
LNFGLPGTPEFRGFEVDLSRAIARELGVEVEYRSALWSVILDELRQARLDVVCSAATITEARRRDVEFSDPYLDIRLVLVTRAGMSIRGVGDLDRRTVGVRSATEAERFARIQAPGARFEGCSCFLPWIVRSRERLRSRRIIVGVLASSQATTERRSRSR